MLGYPLRFCSGGAWPKIITLADICKPLLCARCGSHEYDMHFLHPYPIRMQILLLSPMFKWRNQDLGGLISLPEVTQIISMGTKSLMPVGHSDSRDRLNVSVHLQAHMCTGLGWGSDESGEYFACLTFVLNCAEISVTLWKKTKYVYRYKMNCIYHPFLSHSYRYQTRFSV